MSGIEPFPNFDDDDATSPEETAGDIYGAPNEPEHGVYSPFGQDEPVQYPDDEDEPMEVFAEDEFEEESVASAGDEDAVFDAPGPFVSEGEPEPELEPVEEPPGPFGSDELAPEPLTLAGESTAFAGEDSGTFGIDTDEVAPPLKNRPAEGARIASADEVFNEEFIGSEGASDFLGLDLEFDPSSEAVRVQASGDLDLESQPFAAAPATAVDEEDPYGDPDFAPEDDYAEREGFADDDDYLSDDIDDDIRGVDPDDLFGDELEPVGGSRRIGLMLGGGFCVGLAAVVLAIAVPRYLIGTPPEPVQVAGGGVTPPPPPVQPAGGTDVAPVSTAPGFGPTNVVDPRLLVPHMLHVASNADAMTTKGPDLVVVTDPTVGPAGPQPDVVDGGADPFGGDPGGQPVDPEAMYVREQRSTHLTFEDLILDRADPNSFFTENLSDLDVVWRGKMVPLDALKTPAKILTPGVGQVRVHMVSGDIFEGRLFAVGQNKIWVDMDLGRIGLDGSRVKLVEHLVDDTTASVSTEELATGKRVRAQVPGGVIYGRVRSVDGKRVTLVTDQGARITLEDPVIETVSDSRSVAVKGFAGTN